MASITSEQAADHDRSLPGSAWVKFSRYASLAVMFVGCTVMVGWLADIQALKSVLPGRTAMNPLTALSFSLAGMSLLLQSGQSARERLAARSLAVLVGLFGVVKLADYALEMDLGIDRVLFAAVLGGNQMAPNTAANLVAVGVALWLLPSRPLAAHILALCVGIFALGALIGYAYSVSALYGIGPFTPMALNTAGCFSLLAAGILTQQPGNGLMEIVTSPRLGGYLVRRLLPSAFAVPFLLGWLRLAGQNAGFYGTESGVALFAAATILTFASLVLVTGVALNRADGRREQAEQGLLRERHLLHALMNNLPDSIYFKDVEGRFTRINHALAERLGLQHPEAAIGKTDFDFFSAQHAAPAAADEQEVMRTGRPITGKEEEEVWSDGRRSWVSTTKMALRGPAGNIVGTFGVSRDITERKRMEETLGQREKLASIGLLSAGIAHEINNPLSFVGNNIFVLERDCGAFLRFATAADEALAGCPALAGEARQGLDSLREACDLPYLRDNLDRLLTRTRDGVQRVARIVQSLRSLARSDRPEHEDATIASLVEMSLEVLRGRLQRRGITVTVDLDGLPRLRCVATQIAQVLLNLLTNALQSIESSNQPNGTIQVRGHREQDDVVLEVADDGPGIEAAHISRIFDPFFTTKPVGEGTGLGLSISHTIVTSHGGHIDVHSRPGEGTTFTIRLPINPRGTASGTG